MMTCRSELLPPLLGVRVGAGGGEVVPRGRGRAPRCVRGRGGGPPATVTLSRFCEMCSVLEWPRAPSSKQDPREGEAESFSVPPRSQPCRVGPSPSQGPTLPESQRASRWVWWHLWKVTLGGRQKPPAVTV